eukprot:scaffold1220_cov259-Pinguiococcus_pyrenoidosus.AAC.29
MLFAPSFLDRLARRRHRALHTEHNGSTTGRPNRGAFATDWKVYAEALTRSEATNSRARCDGRDAPGVKKPGTARRERPLKVLRVSVLVLVVAVISRPSLFWKPVNHGGWGVLRS